MNKSESKYFNTACLMDEALLYLLEKKDIEFITVKEICQKAGVNRSTFYLHYENIYDLLAETIEMLNKQFMKSFNKDLIISKINNGNIEDLFFLTPEYLKPYLMFIKDNKRVFKIIHKKPYLFNVDATFQKMYKEVFDPILNKFNVEKNKKIFIFEFFTNGVVGLIMKWVNLNCEEDIDNILNIILDCVQDGINKRLKSED